MVPSRTRTSAANRPSEVTTVPPLMRISCAAGAAAAGVVAAKAARSTAVAAAVRSSAGAATMRFMRIETTSRRGMASSGAAGRRRGTP